MKFEIMQRLSGCATIGKTELTIVASIPHIETPVSIDNLTDLFLGHIVAKTNTKYKKGQAERDKAGVWHEKHTFEWGTIKPLSWLCDNR